MALAILTEEQQNLIDLPANSSIFLSGEVGSGKTTSAVERLKKLMGVFPGCQILVLVPQRSLGVPYEFYLNEENHLSGSLPQILTFGGLARRLIDLFWPLISKSAGFSKPNLPPQFLSSETAQYCMEKAISPLIDQGFFRSVVLARNRLYGQILDNLNKSAVIRFPLEELSQRLKSVAILEADLKIAYDQVQIAARHFRNYCLKNNLLDFSLQIDLFCGWLSQQEFCTEYLKNTFHVLLADNVEEDVPVTHDFIKEFLPACDSSLILMDHNGGYRSFLGADPLSALTIKTSCTEIIWFNRISKPADPIVHFSTALRSSIMREKINPINLDFDAILKIQDFHFYPEMISAICDQIRDLINLEGVSPEEIVILSPYVSDSLNFSLSATLKGFGIPSRSSRPSRMYIDDPVIRAFFTFSKLAHPDWGLKISFFEMRNALMVVLPGLDIIKADLIVRTLFSVNQPLEGLRSFDTLTNREMQERITFSIGEKLETIRKWISEYKSFHPQPLDVFINLIFGEVFSQKGFALFDDQEGASRIARIAFSIYRFRQFLVENMNYDEISAGLEYLKFVENGLLPAAIYSNAEEKVKGVLISPAHTFLMENRKVDYQFWLDIGSMGWWERLNQPLANPYLLNRNKDPQQLWTDAHEFEANQIGMLKIVGGLVNRCGKKIIANAVQTNEYGSEQRGPLLQAFQILQKNVQKTRNNNNG